MFVLVMKISQLEYELRELSELQHLLKTPLNPKITLEFFFFHHFSCALLNSHFCLNK